MSHKKINLIFSLFLVLFLGFVPVIQAAPPAQEEADGDTLGETLNLDDIEDEDSTGKNNLGRIMSGKDEADESDEEVDDDSDETDDGDVEDDADDTDDDDTNGDTDDEEADDDTNDGDVEDNTDEDGEDGDVDDEMDDDEMDDEDEDGAIKKHPVASALADYFDVEYDEIKSLHDEGYGFGLITKAYFFADQLETPMAPEALLEEGRTMGWGNALKSNGIHPGSTGKGMTKWSKNSDATTSEETTETGEVTTNAAQKAGPPGQMKKNAPQSTTDSFEFIGQGNGKGKGNGGKSIDQSGKGKGQGNGKANGGNKGKGNGGSNGNGGGNGKGKGKK